MAGSLESSELVFDGTDFSSLWSAKGRTYQERKIRTVCELEVQVIKGKYLRLDVEMSQSIQGTISSGVIIPTPSDSKGSTIL